MDREIIKTLMDHTKEKARTAAAEGIVMLENRDGALPLESGEKLALFGRCQIDHYMGGTGSGGLVNTDEVRPPIDRLRERGADINEELEWIYRSFIKSYPADDGGGKWAAEPLCRREMRVTDELAERISGKSDTAIAFIGRTAGEDRDAEADKGSYYLTDIEAEMLSGLRRHFKKLIVLLNVPAVMDMSYILGCDPDAVLYIWQGGVCGAEALADVLFGEASPGGRLVDTIAKSYGDYPSAKSFFDEKEIFYTEDAYVGYRYFETFAPDKVTYPFGYGLSYTEFEISAQQPRLVGDIIMIDAEVRNTGGFADSEVVQIYFEPPFGDRPVRELAEFIRTDELKPGESRKLLISFPVPRMARYDEKRSVMTVDKGEYKIIIGKNIRSGEIFSVSIPEEIVVRSCVQSCAPIHQFKRMCRGEDGEISYEIAPVRRYSPFDRAEKGIAPEKKLLRGKHIKLADVKAGRADMSDFVAQLGVDDLACIVRGEGMDSPKVRPGTAAAFGGITDSLRTLGIPAAAAADGPAGLRLGNGDKATLIPIETMLACTWDKKLVRELYSCVGAEAEANEIDVLLGPGINIHRNPLCGRNFEYFSEDPYISGALAAAAADGLWEHGVAATLKHLAANNRERGRRTADSVVSERAMREIYLRAAEYAISLSSSEIKAVMTAYNPLNGVMCASNYDLISIVLRGEFGFDGMVMTDWLATMNSRSSAAKTTDRAAMLRGGGDIYMVVKDSAREQDNIMSSLENGTLTRGDLQRAAANICGLVMRLHCMDRPTDEPGEAVRRSSFKERILRKLKKM